MDTEPVLLGKITGVYGVRGWVRLHSYTEPREAILDYEGCFARRQGGWQAIAWAEGRRHGKTVVARLEGVDDREGASRWVGTEIAVPRGSMPDAGADRYYWTDLEGLEVVNKDGKRLGRVDYLLATGANDVLVVSRDDAGERREVLIPFITDKTIRDVNLGEGRIDVDWDWE